MPKTKAPMFQRRHYEAIAIALANAKYCEDMDTYTHYQICEEVAFMLSEDNPRFNKAKFMEVCNA